MNCYGNFHIILILYSEKYICGSRKIIIIKRTLVHCTHEEFFCPATIARAAGEGAPKCGCGARVSIIRLCLGRRD